MSAEMNCSAGSPTQFGQIDMPSSYLAGASAQSPMEGFLELQGTLNRVHLSKSTRSPVEEIDGGRQPPCPPLSTVSKARVSGP